MRSLNPVSQVPTLVLPSGQVMTESAAITLYLADLYGRDDLVPGPNPHRRPVLHRCARARGRLPAASPESRRLLSNPAPCPTVSELRHAKGAADGRLLRYCAQLDSATLDRIVTIVGPQRLQHDTRRRLLAHLFEHQTHHRGQAHVMLAGTTVKAPQLDEFFPEGEADIRAADFAALGWTESMIWDDGVAPSLSPASTLQDDGQGS